MYVRETELQNYIINHRVCGYERSRYPFCVAVEWEVEPSGKGDLVFTNADETKYLVIETKVLHNGTGSTASNARTVARRKNAEQVQRYTDAWAKLHPLATVVGLSCEGKRQGSTWKLTWGDNLVKPNTDVERLFERLAGAGLGTKLAVGGLLGMFLMASASEAADDSD
ncbi:hypothetical protein DFS34DRAFT_592430 [Phlyctochytrium arcticum]|nr:hypothetical protein DFS34DRAFT_592430 [Phlyctochytrium arcticum]